MERHVMGSSSEEGVAKGVHGTTADGLAIEAGQSRVVVCM